MNNFSAATLFTLLAVVYSQGDKSTLLTSKILGGTVSFAKYAVSIKLKGHHIGGASLISPKHAISSAHFLSALPSPTFYGAYATIGDSLLCIPHFIENIVFHPEFNKTSNNPNFAIIHLKTSVILASYVTTIPLLDEDISTGNEGYIAGWGCTKPIQNIFDVSVSQCLKELRVRILPHQICLAYRPKTHISETCTRASSRLSEHAYFGDVGGPLVVRRGGKDYLAGILTYFDSNLNCPEYYTKLFNYRHFIRANIAPIGPQEVINIQSHYELCDENE